MFGSGLPGGMTPQTASSDESAHAFGFPGPDSPLLSFTQPAGWSGAAVWGSTPAIDKQRGAVFFGTGDNVSFKGGLGGDWACTQP